ncbi:MAG: phage tail protein [Clostridiales bacterium]|nr:phage tail protein [Clostridiales bacterium]
MIPILFEGTDTSFTTNGLGRLADAISCSVVEERNGIYELEMQYPVNGIFYDEITEGRIILAVPFDGGTSQPFTIYQITRPLNQIVTVKAQHISYMLSGIVVMPFTASSCVQALSNIETYSSTTNPFTFSTDKSVSANFKLEVPSPARAILAGSSGSILDTYGKGDYEFNRFNVILHTDRGSDNGVTLRYGKNITDIKSVIDMTSVYTGIVPYWADYDGNLVTLTEKVVLSSHTGDYPYKIIKPVDFSDKWENAPTEAQLRAAAQTYVNNNEGWKLKNNITVSFVALWNTEEYKDIAALERVKMCDVVHIIFPGLGINVDAKVIKTNYDVLQEKYNSITVGDSYNSFSSMFTELSEEVKNSEKSQKSYMQKAIDHATDLISGGLGGHVVLSRNADGEPEEILIMDTDDISTAQKVWRWNVNGLGYSSTGYSGQYGTAITMDGSIVANYITSGTMQANRVRAGLLEDEQGYNYWNLSTGEFKLSTNVQIGSQTFAQYAQSVQDQLDGNITSWFYAYAPTTSNAPASTWTTVDDKIAHIGDLFYNSETGYCYRWQVKSTAVDPTHPTANDFEWVQISDEDIAAAMAAANHAQDTADHKRRVFTAQPTTPYDVGDLWCVGANGDILTCTTARSSGNYTASDWSKLNKYTDDTALTTFLTNTYASDKSNLQSQIDGKAETWYQSADPASSWATTTDKDKHLGDLWYKTTDHTTWYYTKENNTYKWVQQDVPDAVFDEIDGKAQIFTSQPTTPYNVGDLWFNSSSSDIMTCVTARATGNYNANDWQKRNKYTDDSALNAFVNGSYATFVTNTNTAIDGKITTFYQASAPTTNVIGDLWIDTANGNKLYRWNGSAWTSVQDTGIQSALNAASNAQTTADGKIVTFAQASQPTATDVGDLWIDTDDNNKMYRWSGSAWVAYTDTSALNTWLNNTYSSDKTNLQNQIDGKAETWYQSADPSMAWTTTALKDTHVGDLWYNTSNGANTTWYYQKSGNTYSWVQQNVPKAVFDDIDGKAQIFVTQPIPPYSVGDLWFGGTSSDIKTCTTARATGSYVASDWVKYNKYVDSTDISNAITTYDNSLNQSKVFNKLTNNGAMQGIYMDNNQLYINASYIASGTIADTSGNTSWNLSTGALSSKKFSVQSTNFTLTEAGIITATGATLQDANISNGSLTMIGTNSWLKLQDGEIHGGRGTTVGNNETEILFSHQHNNHYGNILAYGRTLVLQTDEIAVMDDKSQSTGYTGYSGDFVVDVDTANISHVSNLDASTDTIENVVCNLRINFDTGQATWDLVTFSYVDSVTWDNLTTEVATGYTTRSMVHGIGV